MFSKDVKTLSRQEAEDLYVTYQLKLEEGRIRERLRSYPRDELEDELTGLAEKFDDNNDYRITSVKA